MKKVLAWLLVLTLTAAVSIGATLAYLTDTDEDVNVMTLGKVKIDQLEYERIDDETANENAAIQDFHDNKPLYPGVYEDGFDFSTNDAKVDWTQIGKDGYTTGIWNPEKINNELDKMVFVKNKGSYDAYVRTVFAFEAGNYKTAQEFQKMVHLNLNSTDYTWEWLEEPVSIGNSTYFVAAATYNKPLAPGTFTELSLNQIALDKTATDADVEAFGDTYQILVKTQAIQSEGFENAGDALDEGFGPIANNIPWEDDAPTKGIDLKEALHYLEGGTTKITGKVANVTFGLNKDYPEVINSDHGTLVDVEQDVPAYAYYVKNGAAYDVYVLADDTIYAPAKSQKLFKGMINLETVNGPLDTSRVYTMEAMFDGCESLRSVDCADWDTGKVTSMKYMFYGCGALTQLDVADWNVSNVEILYQLFYSCKKLKSVDLSKWDVSNVKDFKYAFGNCYAFKEVDLSNWNPASATTMYSMFYNCTSLTDVDLSNWKIGSRVPITTGTDISWMFNYCSKLANVNLTGWDVSHVTKMNNLFSDCYALRSLDLSSWDVSNVKNFDSMFAYCSLLKTIYVGDGWDMSSATKTDKMFHSCYNLVGANGTTIRDNPTDGTYGRVDSPEAPGYLTYKAPETTNP